MKIYAVLEEALKKEPTYVSDEGALNKWLVIGKAQNYDAALIGNNLTKYYPDNIWKENYLKEMAADREVLNIDTDKYVITGVPFYNQDLENEFGNSLQTVLEFTP